MKKRILMLGAGFMQGVALHCAKERGWEIIAVDGNPQAHCRDLADRFEPIDLKDRDALVAFALDLKASGGLDGVFTAATDFSASVAAIARACDLPGHSFEAALNATDKLRMRACFEREGVPSPLFVGVDGQTRAHALERMQAKGFSFPVVVKPVDNMGARGCRKVGSPDLLDPAIADAIRYSRTDSVIIEEFMDGPEFSAEALVFNGEIHITGLADRHIFFPPYFIEMGHTIPTGVSESDAEAVIAVFKKGIRALGLSHGVAKGDIKLTKKGAMIGEIAGRLSGGYMSGWTFPYSSGLDLTGMALDLAVGICPASCEPLHHWVSAERAWISIPGKVASVSGSERARTIPYIRDIFPRSNPGDTVLFPVNNVEKCGNCLASAPERGLAVNAAEEACRAIFIRLVAPNPDTEDFLSTGLCGQLSFPPDCFPVPPGIFDSGMAVSVDFTCGPGTVQIPSALVPYLDSRDWQGRTLRDALVRALEVEPGLLAVLDGSRGDALPYWKALLRGGIQGIVYSYDRESL
jgi:biotin carboxylase